MKTHATRPARHTQRKQAAEQPAPPPTAQRTGEEHVAKTHFDRRHRPEGEALHGHAASPARHVGGDLYGATELKLRPTSAAKVAELMAAVSGGDAAAVRRYVADGYSVDKPDRGGNYALAAAAYLGKTEVLAALLEAKADLTVLDPEYQATALHAAAYGGQLEAAVMLIEAGAKLDAQALRNGFTPLHDAAWQGHYKLAERLLELGASARLKGHHGESAAGVARRHGHPRIAALIERHVEQQQRDAAAP